jgi:hypothetical protein
MPSLGGQSQDDNWNQDKYRDEIAGGTIGDPDCNQNTARIRPRLGALRQLWLWQLQVGWII